MMDEVKQRGVFALMKAVVAHMSASTLRKAVKYSTKTMPYDAIFHHLLLTGLHAQTPESCLIIPALSKYFPHTPPPPGHNPEMVKGATGAILPPVKGRCDYYLGGALQWVVEVLLTGSGTSSGYDSGAGEPLSRLESDTEGKYVGLAYTDHLIVDIRVNATGEPTPVQRNERRMSVFFKQGDFNFCNVLCGHMDLAERIPLAE